MVSFWRSCPHSWSSSSSTNETGFGWRLLQLWRLHIFLHYAETIFFLYVNGMVWWISNLYCDLLVTQSLAGIAYSSYRHIQYSQFKLRVHALKDVHEDREEARQRTKDIQDSVNQWEEWESGPATHHDKVEKGTDNFLSTISSLFDVGPWWGNDVI